MATCPNCRVSSRTDPEAIVVEEVLIARPIGTFSLAGAQMKVSADKQLQMRCTRCGWVVSGLLDGDSFVATPDAVKASLARLDGSTAAAVGLLTGASPEELDELGGFGPPDA